MQPLVKQTVAVSFILAYFVFWASAEGLSCNSCGDECADACGTRFFRTCCFNYLRKRSSPPIPPAASNELKENPWFTKTQLEKLVRNEILRQENLMNSIESHQQPPMQHKDNFPRSTQSSNAIGSGHDQLHLIYDI